MKVAAEATEIRMSYDPLPKQVEFHTCPAKYRFFGGGWGNGKTSGGCAEATALAIEYPGCTGLIARKTRPELKATTMDVFFNGGGGAEGEWPGIPQELIRKFNKTDLELTLINGSRILFWPLDEPQKLSNLNLGWFMIDQGEEVPEEMFQMLEGRLRQQRAPRKGIVLFNPEGHNWIWRRTVDLKYPDHKLIHAKTTDNPSLPKDYVDTLLNMPQAWIDRFVMGSFEVFSGQIFPEFDRETHVLNPFPIPEWWEGAEGIDHGKRDPTAILFAKFDDKGNCFIVDEHLEAGQLVSHHANILIDKRDTWGIPELAVIDASAAAEDPVTGRSVIDEYFDHGIDLEKSDRQIPARINRMGEWMKLDPDHPHPLTNETREEGWPHLWVFTSCPNLVDHLANYKWKPQPPNAVEDKPEKPLHKDNHDVDALGYILMKRPPISVKPFDPTESKQDWYWRRIRERMDGNMSGNHSSLGSEA